MKKNFWKKVINPFRVWVAVSLTLYVFAHIYNSELIISLIVIVFLGFTVWMQKKYP